VAHCEQESTGELWRTIEVTTKEAVIEMIRRLPDEASVVDIMAELYFRQKVDEGLRQLDAGEGVDHDEAKRRLSTWIT
jgi:predicted transcriptional regulator